MRNPLFRRKASAPPGGGRLRNLHSLLSGILGDGGRGTESSYREASYRLRELLDGLFTALPKGDSVPRKQVELANMDAREADQAAGTGNYRLAKTWQSYAARKLGTILGIQGGSKLAYGYDVSGELGEVWSGSEELANRENQKNIDDTAQPFEQHQTPPNPANLTRDYQAERDYPGLREFKSKRVHWPPRTR